MTGQSLTCCATLLPSWQHIQLQPKPAAWPKLLHTLHQQLLHRERHLVCSLLGEAEQGLIW